MSIQDYNHDGCLHGFPEWSERQLDKVLTVSGCPSCQVERIAELDAQVAETRRLAQAVVDSGSMFMDLQVVYTVAFNALSAHLEATNDG